MGETSLQEKIALVFREWIGWGWVFAAVVWIAGIALILTSLDKRLPSRLFTAAAVVVWTVIVLAIASRLFGLRPPLAM